MDRNDVISAFAALSQGTRLDVVRMLLRAGHSGLVAGDISTALGIRQNTMSTNLSVLLHAGLIRNERQGRTIRYFADTDAMQGLLSYLLEDCCGGRPELCQPAIKSINSAPNPKEPAL